MALGRPLSQEAVGTDLFKSDLTGQRNIAYLLVALHVVLRLH